VTIITVWGSITASIFFNSIFSDGKVNLVEHSGGQNLKFTIVFKSAGKNNIKIKKKRAFYAKSVFIKLILVFGVTLKQMNTYT